MTNPSSVRAIVAACNDRLVGRTRLQKSAYLMEALKIGFGFDFSYHYYGPFSEELAIAAEDAGALNLVNLNWEKASTGASVAIYTPGRAQGEALEDSSIVRKRKALGDILARYDSISLELAATAHFLSVSNPKQDAWKETKRRKAIKATPERLAKARTLLTEIGLSV